MGYQLINIEELDNIACENNSTLAIAIQLLIIRETNKIAEYNDQVEVEILRVDYAGAYPCLAVKYLNPDFDDIEETISHLFHQNIKKMAVEDLLKFIQLNKSEIDSIKKLTY